MFAVSFSTKIQDICHSCPRARCSRSRKWNNIGHWISSVLIKLQIKLQAKFPSTLLLQDGTMPYRTTGTWECLGTRPDMRIRVDAFSGYQHCMGIHSDGDLTRVTSLCIPSQKYKDVIPKGPSHQRLPDGIFCLKRQHPSARLQPAKFPVRTDVYMVLDSNLDMYLVVCFSFRKKNMIPVAASRCVSAR